MWSMLSANCNCAVRVTIAISYKCIRFYRVRLLRMSKHYKLRKLFCKPFSINNYEIKKRKIKKMECFKTRYKI